MDSIRTLLLARTHTVVLDPDRVASAATRPTRDADFDKFEDELLQRGFVMSLDLAMMIRRLPHQTLHELRGWIGNTLERTLGAARPQVPLSRALAANAGADPTSLYLRRALTWLATSPDHPCPWCAEVKSVGALDPCGHLVCATCWSGGSFAGCPICHRRIAVAPFVRLDPASAERVTSPYDQLRLLHLAFDVIAVARGRFEHLVARPTPLGKDDRAELEAVIDAMGPKLATWLPARIHVPETMAIAVARLWLVAPDRLAMRAATEAHLASATAVLRVAVVLMRADPTLAPPMRLGSVGRGIRCALLAAIDRLDPAQVIEEMRRHAGLWKRVGEQLHPYEHVSASPRAALVFAALRQTDLARATVGETIRAAAAAAGIAVANDRVAVAPFAAPVEAALRAGDVRTAAAVLVKRPDELLRRADHLVRFAEAREPADLAAVLGHIRQAIPHGAPAMLLALAAHVAKRDATWARRVVFPHRDPLHAWTMPDDRTPLGNAAIRAVITDIRTELMARAASSRLYARAVIDRRLVTLPVPFGERSPRPGKVAWPRGSEVLLAPGDALRLFLHWEQPRTVDIDLDLAVSFYDASWRFVGKCDAAQLRVGDAAALHSGDRIAARGPLGASEYVDLDLPRLVAARARHAVMTVFASARIPFDHLAHAFVGVAAPEAAFDPLRVQHRFDLRGTSEVTIPLAIDLETHRLRWFDVHASTRTALREIGGLRQTLAHIGRDFTDFIATGARATLWDLACVHATARANVVYVREGSGAITLYRRRDGESIVGRLGRLYTSEHDGLVREIPRVQAPTWFAVLLDDLEIPQGSAGFVLDARRSHLGFQRVEASDLVAQLVARS